MEEKPKQYKGYIVNCKTLSYPCPFRENTVNSFFGPSRIFFFPANTSI